MSKPKQIEPEVLLGFKGEAAVKVLTNKDAIIYSLGIGFSKDPMNTEELKYTYELHDEFTVFPTISTASLINLFDVLSEAPGLPEFNPMMLLHGEQRVEFYEPLETDVEYITYPRAVDVADKGKGALGVFELVTCEKESNKPVCRNFISVFIRGLGGFGYKGKGILKNIPAAPTRNPDKVVEEETTPNQAIFYRLAGDENPLHIDPNMASLGGFEKPILHGLCFFGISAKKILFSMLQGDLEKFKAIQARFVGHVFPGETLVYSFWKEGNVILFSASTKERGKTVIVGFVETVATEAPKL